MDTLVTYCILVVKSDRDSSKHCPKPTAGVVINGKYSGKSTLPETSDVLIGTGLVIAA